MSQMFKLTGFNSQPITSTTDERPTLAPGVSSYSRVVSEGQTRQDTPTNLDEQMQESRDSSTQQTKNSEHAKSKEHHSQDSVNSTSSNQNFNRTLLIGDSLLSGVNRKGLKDTVHCQPFPDATIKTIKDKISMFDIAKFKNVVIYVGGNDAAQSDNTEMFVKRPYNINKREEQRLQNISV